MGSGQDFDAVVDSPVGRLGIQMQGKALSRLVFLSGRHSLIEADTEQGLAESPEENYHRRVDRNFDSEAAVQEALNLLKEKAVQRGANPDNLETEIVEALQFNMVRGFQSTGKNIRIKVQVKPGLIRGYDEIIRKLSAE